MGTGGSSSRVSLKATPVIIHQSMFLYTSIKLFLCPFQIKLIAVSTQAVAMLLGFYRILHDHPGLKIWILSWLCNVFSWQLLGVFSLLRKLSCLFRYP